MQAGHHQFRPVSRLAARCGQVTLSATRMLRYSFLAARFGQMAALAAMTSALAVMTAALAAMTAAMAVMTAS